MERRTIHDRHQRIIGYVHADGRVTDEHQRLLGRVKDNGTFDAHNRLVSKDRDPGLLLRYEPS